MPKFFAIIVLLCCAVVICRAGNAPQAWVNAVDTNVMERVLLANTNNVAGVRCAFATGSPHGSPMEAYGRHALLFASLFRADVVSRCY